MPRMMALLALALLLGCGDARPAAGAHQAAAAGDVAALAALLDAGSSPDPRGDGGATPLMLAAGAGQTAAVELLLRRGADFTAFDADGRTALMRAEAEGRHGTAQALRRAGARE